LTETESVRMRPGSGGEQICDGWYNNDNSNPEISTGDGNSGHLPRAKYP
jgi:hypothetical protein